MTSTHGGAYEKRSTWAVGSLREGQRRAEGARVVLIEPWGTGETGGVGQAQVERRGAGRYVEDRPCGSLDCRARSRGRPRALGLHPLQRRAARPTVPPAGCARRPTQDLGHPRATNRYAASVSTRQVHNRRRRCQQRSLPRCLPIDWRCARRRPAQRRHRSSACGPPSGLNLASEAWSPWRRFEDEMIKKSPIRRMAKRLCLSSEDMTLVEAAVRDE